jgi:hypothetical protein
MAERRSHPMATVLALPLALAACNLPTSLGGNQNIAAVMPDAVWAELDSVVIAALEPRAFTVRDERIFEVVHVDPGSPNWRDFRKLRQVLVVGEAADPWVAAALKRVDGEVPRGGGILQAQHVWARPQSVTIVLVPPGSPPSVAAEMMPEVGALYVSQMEQYARTRMFLSGEDVELTDSLERVAGFTMRIPNVYRVTEPEPGLFVFRNDQPNPSRLIRQLTVARRPAGEVTLNAATAHDWRADVAARTTTPPQLTDSTQSTRALRIGETRAIEIQGTWSNPPGDWPAGGPVIARLVECPPYTYLVDGWLYAPGTAKFEYMVQIQTLLDSFRCR